MLSSRQLAYEIAVVAIVCVLAIFFLPMAHGPYSAVHGPTTALRSLRNKLLMVLSMSLAALRIFAAVLSLLESRWAELSRPSFLEVPAESSELGAVLRC